ncbi:MAG: tRNA dihydrouridine synthase DusB [Clostridiales bacterium]|nr:tRNA dihydrouridine synthase DusB [Clostridiales bacterium]
MNLKSIKIGNIETKNNLFLAPLAGFSNFAMRDICISFGAGLTFTEMVSCKGLLYDNENTKDLLFTGENEKIKCVQIFGNDPSIMRKALESEAMSKFDIADINFGCPMPKIYNNGEGSAILSNPTHARKIVEECTKSGKTITCKMRTGLTKGNFVTEDFAKAVADGGAQMITVHGRTRDKIYAGEPEYEQIAKAKNSVSIPVIANGGIFTKEDAEKMIDKTGADGIMLARGALERPWLFAEILGNQVSINKKSLINEHIDRLLTHYDDKTVAITFRKQLCLYLKGERNSTEFKQKLFTYKDTASIKNAIDEFFS